jgi:hypothetical protein
MVIRGVSVGLERSRVTSPLSASAKVEVCNLLTAHRSAATVAIMKHTADRPVEEREMGTTAQPWPSAFAFYYWFYFTPPAVLAGREAAMR